MTDLFNLDPQKYLYFALVFFRISAILLTAPVTGSSNIPSLIKINLALIFSLLVFNVVPYPAATPFQADSYGVILLVVKEVLLGVFLGMIPHILFAAVDLAGSIISFIIGFSSASAFDPASNAQTQVISVFKNILLLLIFLAVNAHHAIFEAILLSFKSIPIADLTVSQDVYDVFGKYIGQLFFIGLKLSYPLLVTMVLTNIVFALLAKSIPQMNVFIVGMPLTIILGLIFLMLGMPFIVNTLQTLLFENMTFWESLIKNW